MRSIGFLAPALSVLFLSGCSALGEKSSYSCNAPDGVSCQSVSGIYSNAIESNLPGQRLISAGNSSGEEGLSSSEVLISDSKSLPSRSDSRKVLAEPESLLLESNEAPTDLLSREMVLRVSIFPWEDHDKVLHDRSFIYVIVKESEWTIPHTKSSREIPSFGKSYTFGGVSK